MLGSAAGGTIAADYALSHPDRLDGLVIADNSAGVRDGDIIKAAINIRTKGFDDMPVEFRELGPSYRAANPEGAKLWTELAHKAVTGGDFRQQVANEMTTAKLEGINPPRQDVADLPDFKSDWWQQAFTQQISTGVALAPINWGLVVNDITEALQKVIYQNNAADKTGQELYNTLQQRAQNNQL